MSCRWIKWIPGTQHAPRKAIFSLRAHEGALTNKLNLMIYYLAWIRMVSTLVTQARGEAPVKSISCVGLLLCTDQNMGDVTSK